MESFTHKEMIEKYGLPVKIESIGEFNRYNYNKFSFIGLNHNLERDGTIVKFIITSIDVKLGKYNLSVGSKKTDVEQAYSNYNITPYKSLYNMKTYKDGQYLISYTFNNNLIVTEISVDLVDIYYMTENWYDFLFK